MSLLFGCASQLDGSSQSVSPLGAGACIFSSTNASAIALESPVLDSKLRIVDHPLVAAKLSVVRASSTGTEEFRRNIQDLSILLLAESSRTWVGSAIEVQTPLQSCVGRALAKPVVLVPILRAGLAMVDGIMRMLPDAKVGHLGLYRDEKTLRPVTYYSRLPDELADAHVLLLDPMLATGHSASAAVALLKAQGARKIQFLCVVACPQGIAQLGQADSDIEIITAAVDGVLNDRGYIMPGLGDAGDRYFGT
ncbi:MAG: uracil phosphoribosyltransferase [Chthoniobacterales bacterium]|nr:uracil phosphoribosyltransferase [Chthoniobacterales bacterium]